jgi:nucleoside-diphosphate-sugar epimerase
MIAVIGGAGFLGTRVLSLIQKGSTPAFGVDAAPDEVQSRRVISADVRSSPAIADALTDAAAGAIINLAAVHRDDVRPRSLYDEVNVDGARNVCDAARQNNIQKIIFTSSVAVYGFAPRNTDETGQRNYFNDYGRTKAEAEDIYREWQAEDPSRSLTIVRPTVIFGEGNRGNVYNLLKQIASGRFLMVGNGENVKSMAYVENVAAFLVHALSFGPGVHVYNYVDQPDMTMNELVGIADRMLGRDPEKRVHFPFWLGYAGGLLFDALAAITGKTFPISSIRVKKFCSNTQFAADKIRETGFVPPVPIREALERTIRYEFLEDHSDEKTFETE